MRDASNNLLGTSNWRNVNVGGLGYVSGMAVAADGSRMGARTDVGGGYRRTSGQTVWTQLVSRTSVPATVIDNPPLASGGGEQGVWELAIAPSNALVWWMFFKGYALRSADGGVTFANTNLNGATGVFMSSNGGTQRLIASKCAVDPTNSEVVYVGTQKDGFWRYMSGTWTQIASLPLPNTGTTNNDYYIVSVDPTSSLVGSGATSRRSRVIVTVEGSGIYESTDGGTTFALATGYTGGSPFSVKCAQFDHLGTYWAAFYNAGSTNNLWKRTSGTWTQITVPHTVGAFAIDPKDASGNRIVGFNSGELGLKSLDRGATWVGVWNPSKNTATTTTVPLISGILNAAFSASQGADVASIYCHPTDAYDYVAMGLGVTKFAVPWPVTSSTNLEWIEDSGGMEELVAVSATITPKGTALLCSWDRALIRSVQPTYPATCYPPTAIRVGYYQDYAIDNNDYIVAKHGTTTSYSNVEGSTWTDFAVQPTTVAGGTVAVGNANNIVVFPGSNGQPKYTTDGGATWSVPTFTGWTVPADGTANGFGFGSTATRRFIAVADKNVPGTFYAYNYGAAGATAASQGIWKSTNSGATWTRTNTTTIISSLYYGYHVQLRCVDGDLYLATGDAGSAYDADAPLALMYRSTDGGVNWTAVTGITEAIFAFGRAPRGSTVKTMYMVGWVGGVYGLYRSYDKGVTVTLLTTFDWFDQIWAIAADPTRFGRVVLGYRGTGWREYTYDYTMRLS